MTYITILTKTCVVCGQGGSLQVWETDWERYRNGAYVQDAFPDLLPPAREQIIAGTHPACWVKIFGEDDDE